MNRRPRGRNGSGSVGAVELSAGRRLLGVALIVVAAAAVLVSARLADRGIAGSATTALLPRAPAVGSCLNLVDGVPESAPCDQPHAGEITAAWEAGSRPGPDDLADRHRYPTLLGIGQLFQSFGLPPTGAVESQVCAQAGSRYTGEEPTAPAADPATASAARPAFLSLTLNLYTGFAVAPSDQRLGDLGWSVCVVLPDQPVSYDGTVRNLAAAGLPLPAPFATCSFGRPEGFLTGCWGGHRVEVFGSWFSTAETSESPAFYGNLAPSEIVELCTGLLRERIGVDDPTFDGRLAVETDSVWFPPGDGALMVGVEGAQFLAPAPPDCWLRVVGDGLLTDTLVDLGTRPLPLDG